MSNVPRSMFCQQRLLSPYKSATGKCTILNHFVLHPERVLAAECRPAQRPLERAPVAVGPAVGGAQGLPLPSAPEHALARTLVLDADWFVAVDLGVTLGDVEAALVAVGYPVAAAHRAIVVSASPVAALSLVSHLEGGSPAHESLAQGGVERAPARVFDAVRAAQRHRLEGAVVVALAEAFLHLGDLLLTLLSGLAVGDVEQGRVVVGLAVRPAHRPHVHGGHLRAAFPLVGDLEEFLLACFPQLASRLLKLAHIRMSLSVRVANRDVVFGALLIAALAHMLHLDWLVAFFLGIAIGVPEPAHVAVSVPVSTTHGIVVQGAKFRAAVHFCQGLSLLVSLALGNLKLALVGVLHSVAAAHGHVDLRAGLQALVEHEGEPAAGAQEADEEQGNTKLHCFWR